MAATSRPAAHESIRLHLPIVVLIGTIHAGDGLEQHVVAHRLVEVHAVEDRCVESGQQFLRDNQDLVQPQKGLSMR